LQTPGIAAKTASLAEGRKSPAVANGKTAPWDHPLLVERGGGRLCICLLCTRIPGRFILLLEERHVANSVRPLQKYLGLSLREAEVLFWVAQGKKNSVIAIILGLSTATVEKHLEHILAKLKVETRTAAALCAYEVCMGK
jgi:DNA-binding CsgD family transcriptional regulator